MKIGDIFDLAELLACLDSWSCILAAAVLYLDALARGKRQRGRAVHWQRREAPTV